MFPKLNDTQCCKFNGCHQPGRKTSGYCALHRAEKTLDEYIQTNWPCCNCGDGYYEGHQIVPFISQTTDIFEIMRSHYKRPFINEDALRDKCNSIVNEIAPEINQRIKKIINKYYDGDSIRTMPNHINGKRYGLPRAYDTYPTGFCKDCNGWRKGDEPLREL